MISRSSTHAILALTYLTELKKDQFAGAGRIAEKIKAPRNYLGKILNRLAGEGLLESVKGFNGGVRLGKPASDITLFDIVNPLENLSKWNRCFLGANKCACDSNCAVHDNWHRIRMDYIHFLKSTTLKMVAMTNINIISSDDL